MANPEDAIRSAVPGGIAKPLMLAVLALLASGALFGGGGKESSATKEPHPTPDEGAGGLLGGLGGLLDKLQKGGLGDVASPGLVPAKISRSRLGSLVRPLARTS
jgi:uncharacterized protein YidB (DUF937 family)